MIFLTATLFRLMLIFWPWACEQIQSSGRSHCFRCSGYSEIELGTDMSSWNLQFSREEKLSVSN